MSTNRAPMDFESKDSQALRSEARTISRYLVGYPPPEAMVRRYSEAHRLRLDNSSGNRRDTTLAAFAMRYPWSLPLLDAACGVAHPRAILRSKILMMAAVLETSPEFVDEFLPRDTPRLMLVVKLGLLCSSAVMRTILGLLLYPIAQRYRS